LQEKKFILLDRQYSK